MASAITAGVWQDRQLGKNQIINLSQKAIWVATGNNIQLKGDLPRRGYWIRLDAKDSRPYSRSGFRHPLLLIWVKENRKKLVEAALTLVRYWFTTGQPIGNNPSIGSFEEWCRVIGGILSNVGVIGFLDNSANLYKAMDAENLELEVFFLAMNKVLDTRAGSVKEIVEFLSNDSYKLYDLIPGELIGDDNILDPAFNKRLGDFFRKLNGTRFGDKQVRVERGPDDSHSGTATWRFVCG